VSAPATPTTPAQVVKAIIKTQLGAQLGPDPLERPTPPPEPERP
jgi:hypothetical protein